MTDSRPLQGRANANIAVKTWEPRPYDQAVSGGPTLVDIAVTETFSGDIVGDGSVHFLQVLRPDGSAHFCGLERVIGTLAGRRGSFVLQDSGTLNGNQVEGTWFVVPGSGTEELVGLRGEGRFSATLGAHSLCHLNFHFER